MLKRTRNALLAATTVAALGLTAPAALAQQYPPSTTSTTTSSTTTSTTAASTTSTTAASTTTTAAVGVVTDPAAVGSSAPLVPGAVVDLVVKASSLVNIPQVTGVLNSTPVALPVSAPVGDTVTFKGVKLPSDFEQNAFHTATVTEAGTGRLLVSSRFFVDGKGNVKAAPASGDLPRTGSNSTSGMAKAGAALVAVGAAGVVVAAKRRRDAASTTAA